MSKKDERTLPAAEVSEQEAAGKPDMLRLADRVREAMETAPNAAGREDLKKVVAILETLCGEGIRDLEGLKDYIFDYTLANQQNAAMQEKYNNHIKATRSGSNLLCPQCGAALYRWMIHCGRCGKAISTFGV